MIDFCHLHNHSQYSLLDGASDIKKMMKKAKEDGQQAVALTDHGNMFGAFKFVAEANKAGVKPIVGCEFYMVQDRFKRSFEKAKGEKDIRYHQLLLAKNAIGYQNISKLCSIGYIDGLYGKYPRIDKDILIQHTEGLIATSCCIGAEIPQAIVRGELDEAERLLKWWLDIFGEDYYIEIQRQKGMQDVNGFGLSQEAVNQELLKLARKYNVKTIVTNDSHYLNEEDAEAHDILLCVNTGSKVADKGRFKFPSNDFYFKTKQQMNDIFYDIPEAIETTVELASKVESIKLERDILLPEFPLPVEFKNQEEYLRHLSYEGAKRRFKNITPQVEERLNFELEVINNSGYPGYFLIVQDFTTVARSKGVSVGPGRGSAAGSLVAYCLGITNIDPIQYNLLFERFLNPERVSLPDIDIDFDDEGRSQVIDYVIEKYGRNKVAQIVTYGTMAARSSLRDVGRVMDIPLQDVDLVAKSFPTHLSATLNAVLAEKEVSKALADVMDSDDKQRAQAFRELAEKDNDIGIMIRKAKELEGSVRNTGIHACGIIITPEDITNIIPVTTAKDSDLLVSQYDNSVAEYAGLLKMDFLGLKTLSIMKDALVNIKNTHGIDIDLDEVDLTDAKAYEVFQNGDTIGIFQFESPGMQKHLKDLAPNTFEDIIAMVALYRPGPIQYIPNFIDRKHGRETIYYDLPELEEYLSTTYGITVYQEQVMLLSQKLAGFSKGQADQLRKAMGKKNKALIDSMFPLYLAGAKEKGHDETILKKIWQDWEKFASYAFNKSHATCYAFIAFQTAYLKGHYPAEFMASVLSHNKNDISKINFFLREGRRMGIDILGPDINESELNFSVNKKGQIRFGMSALKGVGEGPVEAILEERKKNGPFKSCVDIVHRVNLRAVNKKTLDSLAMSGGFNCFPDIHPAQYFEPSGNYETYIEHLLKYGGTYQSQKENLQASLFGSMDMMNIVSPEPPVCPPWPLIVKLEFEKEVTGIYMSGHPLDDYKLEMHYYITHQISQVENLTDVKMKIAGIITDVRHGVNQRGNGYTRFTLQDYQGGIEIGLYNDDYPKFKNFIEKGKIIYVDCINKKIFNSPRSYLKINNIGSLESLGVDLTKSITLKIALQNFNMNFQEIYQSMYTEYIGNHDLKILIVDDEENDLTFFASDFKVKVDHKLITYLESNSMIFKLN